MHMNKRKDKDWLKIYWCGAMIQILLICIIRFCLKALTNVGGDARLINNTVL